MTDQSDHKLRTLLNTSHLFFLVAIGTLAAAGFLSATDSGSLKTLVILAGASTGCFIGGVGLRLVVKAESGDE